MGTLRIQPHPRPRPLSFAMHTWHQNSRPCETHGTRDFPLSSESEGGVTWGEDRRYSVQHPSLQDPGGRRWRLFSSQAICGEDIDLTKEGGEGDGCPGAGAEGDGEAGKAASIGSICSRQDLPGWTWLPILHPPADRNINAKWPCPASQPCWSRQEEARPAI